MRSYPAKLLLFGEHTVLVGSSSIAVPLQTYTMSWVTKFEEHPSWLTDYAAYLSEHCDEIINVQILESLLKEQTIQGNIPIGYGLGSSGALTAAIYDICGSDTNHDNYQVHQKNMAKMESFFHGQSSGFDPLISYVQRPIYKDQDGLKIGDRDLDIDLNIGLIDSGKARKGREMIQSFLKNYDEKKHAYFPLIELNTSVASSLYDGKKEDLLLDIKSISTLQLELMDFLITEDMRTLWEQGLSSDRYYMKICGAGGGGYFLCFARDVQEIPSIHSVNWLALN